MSVPTATLCLTVDNLGRAREIGNGTAVRPDPDEPGLKVGLPRALDLFAELDVTATFFVEGWNGLHHRQAVEAILEAGHEVGLHGWVHEKWAMLDDDRQEVLLWDGTAALRGAGADPRGFRAPGGYRGTRTAAVLADLGYRYDSSIEQDTEADPLAVHRLANGIAVVPWHWDMNDYWQYYLHPDGPRSEATVRRYWSQVFDAAADTGDLVTLTLHPFVSFSDDAKFDVVRALLTEVTESPRWQVINAADLVAAQQSPDSR